MAKSTDNVRVDITIFDETTSKPSSSDDSVFGFSFQAKIYKWANKQWNEVDNSPLSLEAALSMYSCPADSKAFTGKQWKEAMAIFKNEDTKVDTGMGCAFLLAKLYLLQAALKFSKFVANNWFARPWDYTHQHVALSKLTREILLKAYADGKTVESYVNGSKAVYDSAYAGDSGSYKIGNSSSVFLY